MSYIQKTVDELRNEADIDFTSLPFIAGTVREDLHLKTQAEIRYYALAVVKGLMARGVFPGDYTLDTLERDGFQFWPGAPDELLRRIENEWIAQGKTPTLIEPICWFALKSSNAA